MRAWLARQDAADRLPALQRQALRRARRWPSTTPAARCSTPACCATVNSDDPAYFGGYVDDNYRLLERDLGIGRAQLVKLAENSFRAAFLDAERRERYLAELGAAASASTVGGDGLLG